MMKENEEIPCCENCDRYSEQKHPAFEGNVICYCGNERTHIETKAITKRIGCLEHPGARAYLNKDVIEKLENSKLEEIPYGDNSAFNDGIDLGIALLRGDVE